MSKLKDYLKQYAPKLYNDIFHEDPDNEIVAPTQTTDFKDPASDFENWMKQEDINKGLETSTHSSPSPEGSELRRDNTLDTNTDSSKLIT